MQLAGGCYIIPKSLSTWDVTADRSQPSQLWLWCLAILETWFGDSVVLQLNGASRLDYRELDRLGNGNLKK